MVDQEMATEVGFFLEAFHKEFVCSGIEFPVDVAGGFAHIVQSVLGELDREAVEGTAMESSNKSLDHLFCEEVECFVLFRN